MELIIGGAYQGKSAYAVKKYGLTENDIFTCTEDGCPVFGAKCVDRLEEFTLYCVRGGIDAVEFFKAHRGEWSDSALICRDIFCGVVPMGADMRAWREMTGRLCAYLSAEAETVTRIFCGLEQKLK